MTQNRAIARITTEKLAKLLSLPEGCRIHRIIRNKQDEYIFFLQGSGMPLVNPDNVTPEVKLEDYRRKG